MKKKYSMNLCKNGFIISLFFLFAFGITACQHEDDLEIGDRHEIPNLPEVTDAQKEAPPIKSMVFLAVKDPDNPRAYENVGLTKDVQVTVSQLSLTADFSGATNKNFDATKLKIKCTFSEMVRNINYKYVDLPSLLKKTKLNFSGQEIVIPILYQDFTTKDFTYNLNFSGMP